MRCVIHAMHGTRILHCLTCCGCPKDGYTVLTRKASGMYRTCTQAQAHARAAHTHAHTQKASGLCDRKYQLDDVGDKWRRTRTHAHARARTHTHATHARTHSHAHAVTLVRAHADTHAHTG